MKNIYITDLDHTFLRNDLSISDYTQKVWNSYENESILSVATARTYKKTMQFLDGFVINAPMILLDGALVATKDKKIIDTKFISKSVVDEIIALGAKVHIYPFIITLVDDNLNEAFLHSNILNTYQSQVLKRYTKDDNLQEEKNLEAMEKNFKVVYMGEETQLRELQSNLIAVFGDSLKYILAPEAYVGCYFLTILHAEADKAHGIQTVRDYMDFDLKSSPFLEITLMMLGCLALQELQSRLVMLKRV